MKISLKYRIAIVFFILAGLMMAMVLGVTLSRSYEVNRQHLEDNEQFIITQILDLSRIALFTSQFDDLQPYIEQSTEDPHIVHIIIANRANVIVVSSDVLDIGDRFDINAYANDNAWKNEAIQNSSGTLGTLAIRFSHEQLSQANEEALLLGIKMALFGIVVIAVVGIVMGHVLTRRLHVLSGAATEIASGNLDARTGLSGGDEVAIVGSAFDRMADRISEYVNVLQKSEANLMNAHAELEQRVEQRTAELAIARDEALEASRTKSQFLANMSHELRTPLNAIIGYSELLMEEAKEVEQDDFVIDLEKINIAGTHLLTLIDDILDLSKIEAGKMPLVLEWFDVRESIEETTKTLHPLIGKNRNSIHLSFEGDVGSMYADKTKVRQVLINLISNATKFAPGSKITVSVAREKNNNADWMMITVRDTGAGISEEKLSRLFDEFSQLDSIESTLQKGTGLGLVISKKFCVKMGGDITVKSKLDVGTTFVVRLPVLVEDVKAAS